jgi:hypothetical protein
MKANILCALPFEIHMQKRKMVIVHSHLLLPHAHTKFPTLNKSNSSYYRGAKISLGGTTRNLLAKIIGNLNPILKLKFHLVIHWFI